MELLTLISAFCVAVSFVLPPCASDQVNVQTSPQQYGNSAVHQAQFTLPVLPRKLRLQEDADVKSSADKDIMLHKKLLESSSGKRSRKRRKYGESCNEKRDMERMG